MATKGIFFEGLAICCSICQYNKLSLEAIADYYNTLFKTLLTKFFSLILFSIFKKKSKLTKN